MISKINKNILSDFSLHAAIAFLFGMLGAIFVAIILYATYQPAPLIATVNITQLVDQFIRDAQQKNTPQNMLEKETKYFGKKLEISLKQLAGKNNLILLPSEAVISNAPDYTDQIRAVLQGNKENDEI